MKEEEATLKKALNFALYAIAILYLFIMLDLLFRFNIISSANAAARSYNLIPFKTIWKYMTGAYNVSFEMLMINVPGNIAVFIPFGTYLQVFLKNKTFLKSLLILILTVIAVEGLQFAFAVGACDVDDLILNVFGGVIGIFSYRLLRRLKKEDEKAKIAVAIISIIVGLPIICTYFYIFISMFFNRRMG
jgi:Glycopeptide antibiotics resistance protein